MHDPPDADGTTTATAGFGGPATPLWLERLWTWGPTLPPALLAPLLLGSYRPLAVGLELALLCVVTVLAVGLRFRYPPVAWATSLAVVPLTMLSSDADASLFLLVALAPTLPLAALATAWPVARSLLAAATTALTLVVVSLSIRGGTGSDFVVVMAGLSGLIAAAAWLVGFSLRTRAQYAASLEARARDLERERDARGARAVAEERVRIARDLHDLVSHNVAVMVVQAEAADVVWDADPIRAREALRAVSETGRSAMGELRAMLHAMRVGDDGEPERRAQQGLDALPRIVEQVRASGQRVELTVEGDLTAAPATVGGSLLRVAQEGLTNVLRHAAAETAWVAVRVADDEVSVSVEDDGVGLERTAAGDDLDRGAEGGHGLLGIRERVAVLNGRFAIGPGPRGGTRLAVTVPLAGSASDRADRQAESA
ncbi:MAG: sensor histidine kinase [Patulibacter sp.]